MWFAVQRGFYETWAALFNIVISIYLAVFLGPMLVEFVPASGNASYSNALTVLTAAAVVFLILHGISYVFLTGQFEVTFPKTIDILAAAVLGFLAGFLIWSFVSLLFFSTPLSRTSSAKKFGFNDQTQQTSLSTVRWWCNLVDSVVASTDRDDTPEQALLKLLNGTKVKAPAEETLIKTDANEPGQANQP